MIGVAAAQVATERTGDLGVAGVVSGIEDELAQGLEVAFDAVQVAGGGRRGDEFHVVRLGPGADLRRPVQREVVVDQVDAPLGR